MLSAIGFQVNFAKDGDEAIELYLIAKESDEPFDAVIMDLYIPGGMGGKEAMKKLIALSSKVKAIVSYSNLVMVNFRQHGFSAVIQKPKKTQSSKAFTEY